MPLAIPMNRQRGGAWANVGGPGFTRDLMAMGQQDVSWAQQMDMFYAGLEQAETQFEETLAERTRQYDVGFGERQRTFDIRQENWRREFGFAEEQWGERKETMDIEQAQRTFDLEQSRVRARRATGDYEIGWRESGRIAREEAKEKERRRPSELERLREQLQIEELERFGLKGPPPTISRTREYARGPGGSALSRWEGVLPSEKQQGIVPGGGDGGRRTAAQPTQSFAERWAQADALSAVKGFIRMQEGTARGGGFAVSGPSAPSPSYNAPWEGYLSPTELGTAPDYGFGWQEEEEEEEYVGPEFALY